ncbi:MAG: serine protein kinase RIO, partial [Candidatus Micrarchaeota archaeon]|nr:serine protein kinase RIO [Candidatus Micrarchaeota archaeon]
LSEFNILVNIDNKKRSHLYLIDMGQAVLLDHPMAEEFLKRDVHNLVRYFSDFGVKADPDKIIEEIRKTNT